MSPLTDSQAIAPQTQMLSLAELYEVDDHLWLEETIKLLRAGNFSALDLENLIEELEFLGKSQRLKAASLLEQIIRHLLMLQYWETELEQNSNHWQAEVFNFRNQLNQHLTTTLRNHIQTQLNKIYQRARKYITLKSGGKINEMPLDCPYSLEELLDEDYL